MVQSTQAATQADALIASLRAARSSGEITRLIKDLKPSTAKEFTICLSAYGRVRDWMSAIALLDEMRRCGVEPDVYGFSAAIQACEKCRQWERALSLLEEMADSVDVQDKKYIGELWQGLGLVGKVQSSGRWAPVEDMRKNKMTVDELNERSWEIQDKIEKTVLKNGVDKHTKILWEDTAKEICGFAAILNMLFQ